ncbi:SHOCT domain-containing protein [Desulfolithobacter sp.]
MPGPLGWIATLLFWGLIIYLGIWFFKTLADRNRTGSLEVLKERYARGEIDEEQYQRMKSTLE